MIPDETLDYLLEGFQVFDFDWRYVFVNQTGVKHSRYPSKEDLLGHTLMEKFPGIEHTDLFKTADKCMKQRQVERMQAEFIYPDEVMKVFEVRMQPVPAGICILTIDITDQKNSERENREYIKGLEGMMHMTSHRVRQPISHILGACNVLELPQNSTREVKMILEMVKESAKSLDTFTRDLTRFLHEMSPSGKK